MNEMSQPEKHMRYLQLLLPFAVACHAEPSAPPTEALAQREVETITTNLEDVRAAEAVAGTVRARVSATLEAKIPGRIVTLPVRVGDSVKTGQTVATLDAKEVASRYRQARAVLSQARAELDRYTRLYEEKAATRQEFEAVRTRHAVASEVVEEAQSQASEAKVLAPFDGLITRRLADVGDLATPGRPLVTIEAPGGLRLEAAVSDTLVSRTGRGAVVPVELGEDIRVEGTVAEVSPSADPSSRTYLVKLDLPEEDGIRSGMFGRALFSARSAEILRLPVDAIQRRGQLERVFVVEGKKARLRIVRTGKRFGDLVEVASGLSAGEQVIVGSKGLIDGQPVVLR